MPAKIAAGNWKMNGSLSALAEVEALGRAQPDPSVEVLLCPPATLIGPMAEVARAHGLRVGGQDCHPADKGAHTGDISAAMLAEVDAVDVSPLQLIIRNKLLLTLQALILAKYQKNTTMTKAVRYTIRSILRNPLSMRSMITLPTSKKKHSNKQ